jgi:hypothetical protein
MTLPLLVSLAALGPPGCGGAGHDQRAAVGVVASHGGTLLTLPGGKGFVELVVEPATPKSAKTPGALAAYFLKADGTGPIDPTPTGVTFTPERGKPVKLAAKGDHFVSEPGPYTPGRELSGELTADIGGPVQVPVQTR